MIYNIGDQVLTPLGVGIVEAHDTSRLDLIGIRFPRLSSDYVTFVFKTEDVKPYNSMGVGRYRKRPLMVEAFQYDPKLNQKFPPWLKQAVIEGTVVVVMEESGLKMEIKTSEGTLRADISDWIVRGVTGELYPCKPEMFELLYEEVLK